MATTTINFDSYTTGNIHGQDGWVAAGNQNVMEVTTGQYVSSGKSLMDDGSGSWDSVYRDMPSTTTLSLSFNIRWNETLGDAFRSGYVAIQQQSPAVTVFQFGISGTNVVLNTGSGAITIGSSFSLNTWYAVNIEVRSSDGYGRAQFNGGSWSSYYAPVASYTTLDRINIGSLSYIFYVDDIVWTTASSASPSYSPSVSPSISPSLSPSKSPSLSPSVSPSKSPSFSPSQSPSASISPSRSPSQSPSASLSPSLSPSQSPSSSSSPSPSPGGQVIDYVSTANTQYSGNLFGWYSSTLWSQGQSFYSGNIPLAIKTVELQLFRSATQPTGNIYAKIYEISGTSGTDAIPTGDPIATSNALSAATVTNTSGTKRLYTLTFPERIVLPPNRFYFLVMEFTPLSMVPGFDRYVAWNRLTVNEDSTINSAYYSLSSGVWLLDTPNPNFAFYVYGQDPWTNETKTLSNWTQGTKHSTSFTNPTKKTTSWANTGRNTATWTPRSESPTSWTSPNKYY